MFHCDSRLNESEDDIPEDAKLDQLSIADIGKDRSRPHLTVRRTNISAVPHIMR